MSIETLPTQAPQSALADLIMQGAGFRTSETYHIHPEARESYFHWWKHTATDVWLWMSYRHLPASQRPKYVRLLAPRDWVDRRPWVSHTCVLPDGQEIVTEWQHGHGTILSSWTGPRWGASRVSTYDDFRQRKAVGVKKNKGRKKDSFDRCEKTRDFRNNDKTPCAWPFSNGAKRSAQIECNRSDRRKARALIQQGRFEEVETSQPPTDTWMWD